MKSIILGVLILLPAITLFAFADEGQAPASSQSTAQNDEAQSAGATIFNAQCVMCHLNGGNRFYPNMPLVGAPQLNNFKDFLAYIRHPTLPDGSQGPMPPFTESQLTDSQAKALFQFIKSEMQQAQAPQPPQGTRPGYGYGPGYGMGPRGYGMGPGMMGPHGHMGRGMMGPGNYGWQPNQPGFRGPSYQPTKPLDEKEARQEVENYLKSTRNPNLKLGEVADKGTYFVVQIVTRSGSLVDKIVVNKKTGLMHSAY